MPNKFTTFKFDDYKKFLLFIWDFNCFMLYKPFTKFSMFAYTYLMERENLGKHTTFNRLDRSNRKCLSNIRTC